MQTKSDSVANIKSSGTSVPVLSDSLVPYQGSAVKLEHGSLNVATSKSMTALIGGLKVAPAGAAWTEFEVRETYGAVRIIARKGDVKLIDASGTSYLGGRPGNDARRDLRKGEKSVIVGQAAPCPARQVGSWIRRRRSV